VEKGSRIDVFVSLGPEKLTIPDVTGMKESDAVSTLNNAGFKKVKTSKIYDNVIEAGFVVRLEPAVNTQVSADTEITVYVSMGADPKNRLITVPNLSGMSYEKAINKLKSIGLKAGTKNYKNSDAAANTVISQNPAANSRVTAGTRVNLVISGKKTAADSNISNNKAADSGKNKPSFNFKWQIDWKNGFPPKK